MPQKTVDTRLLVPEAAELGAADGRLHQPVQQLDAFPPPYEVEYLWFTPQSAREWLISAENVPGFKQRPLQKAQARRWKNLICSDRFVHFLPNQAVCTDPDGVMLNGQHRLSGLAEAPEGTRAGFMVIRNVPRWMFAFFDTNKVRTLRDVFTINNRVSTMQTSSAMRLGIRYEEFVKGTISAYGWRHWRTISDEHQDVDSFMARRDEIQDWSNTGEKVYRKARILAPSMMVFAFYQNLAWPGGDAELHDFAEALCSGPRSLSPDHPVARLRGWSQEIYMNKQTIHAKREVHLALLFRTFAQAQNPATRIPVTNWAYGQPMTMPYHPGGAEIAVKNIRTALEDIDHDLTS